jgi:hypothetical protein
MRDTFAVRVATAERDNRNRFSVSDAYEQGAKEH